MRNNKGMHVVCSFNIKLVEGTHAIHVKVASKLESAIKADVEYIFS